ncbi:MAG: co-chaperone GroES [Chitinophagaceae bacterium]|nr:MAG: co-chaperone GroES [Chitinophagaceae bacterium]
MQVDTFDKFIVIGDRLLIKPTKENEKTDSGLFLPPGVQKKEKIFSGYVIKTGPGYPIPSAEMNDEFWKKEQEETKYLPLQAKSGDLAVYIQSQSFDIEINKEKYVIVPQSAILLLMRDDEMI